MKRSDGPSKEAARRLNDELKASKQKAKSDRKAEKLEEQKKTVRLQKAAATEAGRIADKVAKKKAKAEKQGEIGEVFPGVKYTTKLASSFSISPNWNLIESSTMGHGAMAKSKSRRT